MLSLPHDILNNSLITKLSKQDISHLRQTNRALYKNQNLSELCYSDTNEKNLADASGLALFGDSCSTCAEYIISCQKEAQRQFKASTDILSKKKELLLSKKEELLLSKREALQNCILEQVDNFTQSKITEWDDAFTAPEVKSRLRMYRGALLVIEFEYLFAAQTGNVHDFDFPGSTLASNYKNNTLPFLNRQSLHRVLQSDNGSQSEKADKDLQHLQHLEIFVAYHSGRKWQISPYLILLHAEDSKLMLKKDAPKTNDHPYPPNKEPEPDSGCIIL